ncbi:MAG: VWA domain-containing protein [Flavobacteriales bacterium]|nr:VWA domain-containing protein [Flavobacteriales bacterium]
MSTNMLNNWNINIYEFEFLQANYLYLLLTIPIFGWLLLKQEKKRTGDWKFTSSIQNQEKFKDNSISYIRQGIILLKLLIIAFAILALAKPFRWNDSDANSHDYKYGIDIVIALDVSLSMLATDFEPNRLEAAKEVANEFIDGRRGDRIGLVVYAGESYTACPMTLDYEILKKQIDEVDGMNIEGGTAIGTGLGTGVVNLRSDSLKSKVIILLTDGSNNAGDITPLQAAELAKTKNICVYTIGVGSNGVAPTPVVTPVGIRYENMPVEIDEVTLNEIADVTGGKYFRATDKKSLAAIYEEIDRLEKSKMADKYFQSEPPPTPAAFLNWIFVFITLVIVLEFSLFVTND